MLISGAVLPYDHEASEKVLKLLRNVAKRTDKEKRKLAHLVGRDVNDPAIVNGFSRSARLSKSGDRAANPDVPVF